MAAKAEVAEGNTLGMEMEVWAILSSTQRALADVMEEKQVVVVIPREEVGEMAVGIEEQIEHAVVTWVEVAVRAIVRGHDEVVLAEEAVGKAGAGAMVWVVGVVGQRAREAAEAAAKVVSSSVVVVVEAAATEVGAGAGIEAEVEVGARRTGVVLGEEAVVVVPTSVVAVAVATLRVMSARSTQTQS